MNEFAKEFGKAVLRSAAAITISQVVVDGAAAGSRKVKAMRVRRAEARAAKAAANTAAATAGPGTEFPQAA